MVFPYHPFDVYRVCSDIACFIPETNSLLLYSFFFFPFATITGEGNGTPLQYSCLENPMDGGAW